MEKWTIIGEKLKTTREEKGLTINQVAEKLGIPSWKIRTIEEGAFDRVDAPFYVKQYIRAYAALLELNPDELLEGYEQTKTEEKRKKTLLNGDFFRITLLLILAAVSMFFIYSSYNFFKTLGSLDLKLINLSNDVVYFDGLPLNPNESVILQVGKKYQITNNKGVCAVVTRSKEWRILAENFEVVVWGK